MSSQLAYNIEPFNPEYHTPLLAAAAADGVDVSPVVGGADRFIGFGKTKHGYGPGCILDLVSTPYVVEPHVTWFPWVGLKDRIVHFKWAMDYLAQNKEVFLTVTKEQKVFFDHFVEKKILRKVGYLKDLPIVEEIHMYQYERKK